MKDFCWFWVLLVGTICLFEYAPAAAQPDIDIFPVPAKERKALVLTQAGCPPCARMKKDLAGKKFVGFTLEWGSTRDKKWAVKAAPTTVKLVGGKEVDRKEGYVSPEDLAIWMKK